VPNWNFTLYSVQVHPPAPQVQTPACAFSSPDRPRPRRRVTCGKNVPPGRDRDTRQSCACWAGTPARAAPAGRGHLQKLRVRGEDACKSCAFGAGMPECDILADFLGAQTSNLKNRNISRGDFKKLKFVSDLPVGLHCSSKLLKDSATWYSTHTCSTLPRFNYDNGVII
jgi:hypothetical protein